MSITSDVLRNVVSGLQQYRYLVKINLVTSPLWVLGCGMAIWRGTGVMGVLAVTLLNFRVGERRPRAQQGVAPDAYDGRRSTAFVSAGPGSATVVLLVADVFHPVDGFPVECLLHGDMGHRGRG